MSAAVYPTSKIVVTNDEVKLHCKEGDLWIRCSDRVYDCSKVSNEALKFLALDFVGKDATREVEK